MSKQTELAILARTLVASDGVATAAQGTLAASAVQPADSLDATKLVGTLPAISGASLTGIETEPHKFKSIAGVTFAVTIAVSGGGNRYFIDGVVNPIIPLLRGNVYVFDQSDSSNSNHPLRFKNSAGASYTTGVVVVGTPGQAGAKVTLTVANTAPNDLRYYCTVHGNGMGNTITTTAGGVLDLGTFNFFDQGTLAEDATVTFTNVPTNAKWQYTCVPTNLDKFDISKTVYTGKSFSTAGTYADLTLVHFSYDGTKMYGFGDDTQTLYQYNLSTAWDIYTASVAGVKDMTASYAGITGIYFTSDGLKMALCDYTTVQMAGFTLTTPWDITTITYATAHAQAEDTAPTALYMKEDGSKAYMLGKTNDKIYEYNLTTPWDFHTTVYYQYFSLSAQDGQMEGLSFNSTGTKMYTCGGVNEKVYEYNLSTAWDVTSLVYSQSFSISGQDTDPQGIYISPTGEHLYLSGNTSNRVFQYSIGATKSITLPSSVVGTIGALKTDDRVIYTFQTADAGTTVNLLAEEIL